jgi:hypothetical protein
MCGTLSQVSEGDSPDWVRDGLRQFVGEVRLFLRTAVDFTLHPSRFAAEWATGARHALNPLGFLATAFAVAGPANAIFQHLVRAGDEPTSLVSDALGALTPFGYYLALGGLQHGTLRLLGSRRRLGDSCAMALYAGGGPATVAQVVVLAAAYLLYRHTGKLIANDLRQPWAVVVMVGAMLSFGLFMSTLSLALAGLHHRDGIGRWQIALANVVALLVTGALFALLKPPGSFGLHFVLGPAHDATGWHVSFGLYD